MGTDPEVETAGPEELRRVLDELRADLAELRTQVRAPRHRDRCDVVNELQAMQSLTTRYRLTSTTPRLTPSAMSATTLDMLTDLVERERPRTVLECGSGVSTVWLSYAVRSVGGVLRSLDHLPEYAAVSRERVLEHGGGAEVEVRHAPLEEYALGEDSYLWYARDGWQDVGEIDLLVVDGPPTKVGPLARYPALPLLAPHLAPGALVVVDDAHRRDEREMVARWQAEHDGLEVARASEDRAVVLRWSGR